VTRVRVARWDALAEGVGRPVVAAGRRLALFRVGDEVFALGDRCSHAEASLAEGEAAAGTVECPRHGATFDLHTGAALTFPATRAVPVYPAEVVDGEVFVVFREEAS